MEESRTLKNCSAKLKLAIKINLNDIADHLHKDHVLDQPVYRAVTDHRSMDRPEEKADEVFNALTDAVEQDEDKYKSFVDYLRLKPRKYKKIVELLDSEYGKLGNGAPVNEPEPDPDPKPSVEDKKVPEEFSETFSPNEFADWMMVRKHLTEADCKMIIEKGISGFVFLQLDDAGIKDFGFVGSGYYILLGVLAEIKKSTETDSVPVPKPLPIPHPDDTSSSASVESDFFGRKKSKTYKAQDRGKYIPQLKFGSGHKIAELKTKPLHIPELAKGYYPMTAKKHGVALIINNKRFEDSKRHQEREGTDRDEYNLIETLRFLGYHVEVRREVNKSEMMDIFCNIDEFLTDVNHNSSSNVENDSFLCCILSHGNKFCIYSADSKTVEIDELERNLGESKILNSKPKIFFIQACQGVKKGTEPVKSGLQPDGEIQTSRRADVYISYASAPGDQSYRHIEKGSWFITKVCKTLCEEATSSSLNEMQHSINAGVADEPDFVFVSQVGNSYKQQPSCSDQLRKNVHFFHE